MNIDQCRDYIARIPDINQVLSSGEQFLYYVILQGDVDCLKATLDAGADPHLAGSLGLSALDIARYLDKSAFLPLLGEPEPQALKIHYKNSPSLQSIPAHEAAKELGFSYRPFMRFADYELLTQVHSDCVRARERGYMYTERVYLGMTYKRELESGQQADVSIRWIDDTMGYGLFAEQALRPWELIGVYTGLIEKRPLFGKKSLYCFRYPIGELYPKRYIVEAESEGNVTRFINHSDDANCTVSACYYKGLMHMLVYTHRPVAAGQQLFFDYGAHYWGTHSYASSPST